MISFALFLLRRQVPDVFFPFILLKLVFEGFILLRFLSYLKFYDHLLYRVKRKVRGEFKTFGYVKHQGFRMASPLFTRTQTCGWGSEKAMNSPILRPIMGQKQGAIDSDANRRWEQSA